MALLALVLGPVLALFSIQGQAHAQAFTTTLTSPRTIEWTAVVDPASATAKTTYFVTERFGNSFSQVALSTLSIVFDGLRYDLADRNKFDGSYCYIIKASGPVSGIFGQSMTCHDFFHTAANGHSAGITRTDGQGQQIGFNQLWKFTYAMDLDALVTMKVYFPTATFTRDTYGFVSPAANTPIVRTILDGVPRTGEQLDGTVTNEDFWDSRNSSGTLVNNNLYVVHWTASSPLQSPATRSAGIFTVPVDILRITQFTTEGILAGGSLAKINYTINGDATVRIVIAKPGRQFLLDGNGDIQSLNATQTAIDTSTQSVIQVISFNKTAGVIQETWNGTDSQGVAVSSGVYAVGISARDGAGNLATGPSGDQNPIAGTIPVDRAAAQTATDTTAPQVNSINVGGTVINLAGGTVLTSGFTTITIGLSEAAGTGANSSLLTLTGPAGTVDGGSLNSSGQTVTYSTASTINTNGTYTLTLTAKDTFGNATAATSYVFSVNIDTVAPNVTAITVGGNSISLAGGTSLTSGFTGINVTLNETAGTGVNASVLTLTGPAGTLSGTAGQSGSVVTYSTASTISTPGTYTITITAKDGVGNSSGPVNYTFALADTIAPTVTAINVGSTTISLSGGTQLTSTFTVIQITLDETAGTLANISAVTLSGPSGAVAGGSVTASGAIINYSTSTSMTAPGTYTVTVTPKDALGNAAAPASYTFGIESAAPTITAISVGANAISLGGGTAITGSFGTISITLNEDAGQNANVSLVTLTGPSGTVAGGTVTASGVTVTYSTTAVQSVPGSYAVTVTAKDLLGNAATPASYTFTIAAPAVSAATFASSFIPYPNPVRTAPMQVQFQLPASASVDFDLFTLGGKRLYHRTQQFTAGTNTFNWPLTNDSGSSVASGIYLLRITANDGTQVLRHTKKVMVLR
ncbi:MAG: T9SS type A sorting domain-containing protein [Elusimicrobia bacterium]|nr:T9SS type A sorting domain-containing protein [Elusimicrobiota bacterium]